LPFGIGGGNPEQRLAVAPAGHILVFMFERKAEEAQKLSVERLRAREIAHTENQMIDTDDPEQLSIPPLA
jgi:hypothetical protein